MDEDQYSISDSSSSIGKNNVKQEFDTKNEDSEINKNNIQDHKLLKKKKLHKTKDLQHSEVIEASSQDNEFIETKKGSEEQPIDSNDFSEDKSSEEFKNQEVENNQEFNSLNEKNPYSIEIPIQPVNKKKLLRQMRIDAKQNYIELVSKEVGKLIKSMDRAYEEDLKNYSKGKQAISKLILLPKLESIMNNASKNTIFLSHHLNGLNTIAKWISPYSDGKFPLSDLLLRIIKLLNLSNIQLEDLNNSTIGRAMGALVTSGRIDNEVVKQGTIILDKWQSIVFELKTDYKNNTEDNIYYKRFKVQNKSYNLENEENTILKPKRFVPEKASLDFITNAKGEDYDKFNTNKNALKEKRKQLNELKKYLKLKECESKKNRSNRISIDGKELS